ncbi:hybrid sensor histidine kinase/response regulator [Shimia sp. Alg240-R146]|uniref:hybrid sensor histidine kinase/response regulator n=1 Tax=Shimia sp. Alg240-R146 TaxID=2993449 RepID=UPI0022E56D07|nr:response regulator [Shimia sp. Alg240-R146]
MIKRFAIYGVISALIALLILLWFGLPGQLRAVMTTETDDTQWTVFQLETEFANLNALLANVENTSEPDSEEIRFRTDITLSRVGLVSNGLRRSLWAGSAEAREIIAKLEGFTAASTALIDQPGALTGTDIRRLRDLTDDLRPDVRRLAILGVTLGSQAKEAERVAFATQLRSVGFLAIVLIAGLVGALFFLDRLLARARRKDDDLQVTADRLASTVTASLDGIVISNQLGEIIEFNEAAVEIFGWSRAEILGQKMSTTFVPHQHRDAHEAGMQRFLSTGTPHVIDAGRIELTALRKSGEEFPIELNITSTHQEGENVFIAYIRDISERKINEQKLVEARDRAERADNAKSRFLTVMSHEMRTPLNGILGVLDLLKTTHLDKKQERFVQVAAASSEILLENVNEALDITRIESGVMSLSPEVFSLRDTVQRVADVLRTLATEKGLTLHVEIDASMTGDFWGDGGRINQILTNLIGNAIKFTDQGGVTVTVNGIHGPNETMARIQVLDTGSGIPEDKFEAIFEDFVALARSEGRQSRGDGLGLSIARKIARLMDGDLNVDSQQGNGSSFTLSVPLQRVVTKSDEPAPDVRNVTDDASKSILIVEDNAINRSVLREMLAGFGHAVTEADNGLEGLKKADGAEFDLIIMDISMPFMDGIEATRRIRQGNGPNCQTYVLGLTAHGREEYRLKAKNAGMDGFCTKPLRLSELKETLQGMKDTGQSAASVSGPILVDVIDDLRKALGDTKTQETANRFFAELEEGLFSLGQKSPASEATVISEMLHKLRGSAGLLGLQDIENALAQASTIDDPAKYADALSQIGKAADTAAKAVRSLLSASDE